MGDLSLRLTRDKLAAVFGNRLEVIRVFEKIQEDVGDALPADIEEALNAAEAAQTSADAAAAAASAAFAAAAAAQTAANAAQAEVDAVSAAPFAVLAPNASVPNARTLAAQGPALALQDGGPGASATISLTDVVAILPADVSESAGTFADATGLLVALVANATYLVEATLTFQSAATTTGIGLTFTLPAGATICGLFQHPSTVTTLQGSYNTAAGAIGSNTGQVPVAAANLPLIGRWVIKTAGTAGNAQLQFRSEVAASAVTLKQDLSVLIGRRAA